MATRIAHVALIWLIASMTPLVHAQTPTTSDASSIMDSPASQELTLRGISFGLAGPPRPGTWTPIRVGFTNHTATVREIILRLETTDADGDRPSYERVYTANPGVEQSGWLYLRMPNNHRAGQAFTISAYQAIESQSIDQPFRAGALLARTFYTPPPLRSPQTSVIAVVGRRTLGLSRYAERVVNVDHAPLGHGFIDVVGQLDPRSIPDRWYGLSALDVLVLAGGVPSDISTASANAISEWVHRGGHLIIVLPALGSEWTNPRNNDLFNLLPHVGITRLEGIDLKPLRPLLTRHQGSAMPPSAILHQFTPLASAEPSQAIRVIDAPDGSCVVSRRLLGTGMCTLIGIDLSAGVLRAGGLPDADVFWNRILGKRGPADTQQQLNAKMTAAAISFRRPMEYLDDVIADEVAQEGRAAAGVLLGFVVFLVYWLVAGPGGFGLLKKFKQEHHAWVAFVCTAALFTAIAWGGANLLRPGRVSATHLTVLVHVFGQPNQTARSWASLLIPWYGQARVGIRGDKNIIAPWDTNASGGTRSATFPDARGYRIQANDPNHFSPPVRQTVKQVRADWAGITTWGGMPRPVPDSNGNETFIRIADPSSSHVVDGIIQHSLPVPLGNVTIIVNTGQRTLGRALAAKSAPGSVGRFIAKAFAYERSGDGVWNPGEPLDLAKSTARSDAAGGSRGSALAQSYFNNLTPETSGNILDTGARINMDLFDRFAALLFYGHLNPPQLREASSPRQIAVLKSAMHGLDLSVWMTQPCVIVLGEARQGPGSPLPIPIEVDKKSVTGAGRTIVAWVYPLPDAPPSYPSQTAGSPD